MAFSQKNHSQPKKQALILPVALFIHLQHYCVWEIPAL
jgi:hypothetical protein